LRRNFSSSRLVRLLGDTASGELEAPGQDFAERLSQWVGVFDAVKLHAAHQSMPALAEEKMSPALAARALAVEAQFHQVRGVLVKAITANEADAAIGKRARNPRSEADVALEPVPETEADFAPYRQRYLDQQRNMELMIGPLRAHVRETLSDSSPGLRQLASLDAVWEQMLEAREQRLLLTLPVLLKGRFERLRKAHQSQQEPALWRQPGGWLDGFGKELQEILLAELDVRLEPVKGLMEAFSNKVKKYQ